MNRSIIPIAALLAAFVVFAGCSSSDESTSPTKGTIEGSVSVQPWGNLEGIEISLTGAASRSTNTRSNGRYGFGDLANGSYTVTMASPPAHVAFEHPSYNFTINQPGQVFEGDFFGILEVSGTVTGIVTIDGVPTPDLQVNLNGATITGDVVSHVDHSSADGRYHFSQVAGGTYQVQVIPPVTAEFPDGTVLFNIDSADTTVTVDFAGIARAHSQIWGEVEVNGIGEPGVQVVLTGPASDSATTDAHGNFKFIDLNPGTYTVTIAPPAGTTFSEVSRQVEFTNPRVELMIFDGTRP